MPQMDPGIPLLVLLTAVCWAVGGAAMAADLPGAAASVFLVPVAVAAYRDRPAGVGFALAAAVAYTVCAVAFGTALPSAAIGAAALAAAGLLVAGALGAAASEAACYRLWYHGLRDRLPAAILFFMPATGRIHDLNERAETLLGPIRARSLEESFEDPSAYAGFAADVTAGEVADRGAWLRGADGTRRWCVLAGAMATPVLAVVSVDDRTAERSAADALAASETAYRILVEHAPGARLLVDADLRVIAAGGALDLLAGPDPNVLRRTLWTAFPHRVAQALEPLARLAVFGAAGTEQLDLDGRRFQVEAAPVPGPGGTVAEAVLNATDVTDLALRHDACEDRRSLAEALLFVHRAQESDAAERLLTAVLRLTGSRYGAILDAKDGAIAPLAVSPALADADLAVLAGDAASVRALAVREASPHAPLPLRRILAVPVGEHGVVAVADRSAPYSDREAALIQSLAEEGFIEVARMAAEADAAIRSHRFEGLLAAAPLPLLLAGWDGRIRYENDAARALFGRGAPDTLALRIDAQDRNRVATTEERRRRGVSSVPARYRATVLDGDGAERPCLIAAVLCRPEEATLLSFLDLGPTATFDTCRDRALAAIEARLECALDGPADDPAAFVDSVREAWRASLRERSVLAAPTPFGALPPGCADHS